MHKLILALTLIAALVPLAEARGRSSAPRSVSRSTRSSTPRSAARSSARTKATCTTCTRDSKGRIARSSSTRHEFQKTHPCPATGKTSGACPGYVIDHVIPLKRGGADSPNNVQWQVTAASGKSGVACDYWGRLYARLWSDAQPLRVIAG